MMHRLKILPKYFQAVKNGVKTFEVRKDDRNFKVGDILDLSEWDGTNYTGEFLIVGITYILGREEDEKEYVPEGYVILGIK